MNNIVDYYTHKSFNPSYYQRRFENDLPKDDAQGSTSEKTKRAFGGDISTPVFQGGRLKGNLQAQYAQADASFYIYEQTILKALEEAESSLILYTKSLKSAQNQQEATLNYKKLFLLSEARKDRGLVNTLDLLTAKERYIQSLESKLDTDTEVLLNLISLYKALGGGWEICDSFALRKNTAERGGNVMLREYCLPCMGTSSAQIAP